MNPSDQTHSDYTEEWLSAYIDDELSDAQRAIVEQRVASDSEAQRLLNELQHMRALIGQLPSWSGGLIDHGRVTGGKPQSELSLHSESFEETLEQACRSHDENLQSNPESQTGRVHAAGDVARRDVSWWRPVALAACLALLTGGGLWWWQSESVTTLATSARVAEPQDKLLDTRARDDAPPLPQLQAAPEALGVETLGAEASAQMARRSADGMGGGMDGGMDGGIGGGLIGGTGGGMMGGATEALGGARGATPAAPRKAESLSEGMGVAPPSAAGLELPLPAEEPAPSLAQQPPGRGSADRGAGGGSELLRSSVEERGLAKSSVADLELYLQSKTQPSRLAANAPTPAVQVQLAHSAGWSAAEVTQALQRLAPLLNVPLAASSGQDASGQNDFGRAADIPIALIAQRPTTGQSTPLMDVLSQQPVALQPVALSEAKAFFGTVLPEQTTASRDKAAAGRAADDSAATSSAPTAAAPFAAGRAAQPAGEPEATADMNPPADARQAAPTVALFVLREEAEQILQAARQSGEVLSSPVWITPASGSTTPEGPKQQVMLLFTPQ